MKRTRPFAREYRPLGPPAVAARSVAAPAVVGEIRFLARELQTTPHPLDRHAERAWRIVAAQRIEKLAGLIEERVEQQPRPQRAGSPEASAIGPLRCFSGGIRRSARRRESDAQLQLCYRLS